MERRLVEPPHVTLRNLNTQTPSFTAPNVGGGTTLTLVFELMVSDDSKNGTDNVTVTILPSTNAPSANAGENRTVRSRNRVDLNGTASFPIGSDVKYEWKRFSGPANINIVNSNQIDAYFTALTYPAKRYSRLGLGSALETFTPRTR